MTPNNTVYKIITSVEAMRDACIPVDVLGIPDTQEAAVLHAHLRKHHDGSQYWLLLDFAQQWSLPRSYAAILDEVRE